MTKTLSRREKLLLGLLTSTLIFSASFSYGAVNQSKVDSIMQTINNAASNFSSQVDRDTYYNRVYTGLSDAIDMLAVVRNNVGAMIGTPPVSTPPVSTPPTFTPPASNSAWASPTRVTCPTSVTALQSANPSTVSATNSAGFQYTNTGGIYFNVKNYANASDTALPTSCTTGQKWIAKSGTNSCSIYSCATATPPVSTPPVSGGVTPVTGPNGENNNPLIYTSVVGDAFGKKIGALTATDMAGSMVTSGSLNTWPWEYKLMRDFPRCSATQKSGMACTSENSMCWDIGSFQPANQSTVFQRVIYRACQKNPTIRPNCPTPASGYVMANDTSMGGSDSDRFQMAWDMNNWVQTRINAHQTKVWVWKPNTISKIEKWDGSQPDNTWVSRARKSDDISDMYGRWTAGDAPGTLIHVGNAGGIEEWSVSECKGDFSQEIIDRGCYMSQDRTYSNGVKGRNLITTMEFNVKFLGADDPSNNFQLPSNEWDKAPTCILDPNKTYYMNYRDTSNYPSVRDFMPLFGFDEYKQYAGPVNWGSTLGKWIINKERAPYSRKPCIGFHCESTDPFLDWYGNKEAGYAGESF